MRIAVCFALLLAVGCGGGGTTPIIAAVELGGPIPGLTGAQLASFQRGKALFERRFRLSEGHGPHFNTSSCRSCHEIPVTGGSAPLYRNFILAGNPSISGDTVGVFEGGILVARLFSYTRMMRERVPRNAQIVTQRNTPPLFGIGLLERIDDNDILVNRDPADRTPPGGDGIRGRINLDGIDVGRWGFKSQTGVLERFIRGPLFNHMGITTDPLPSGSTVTQVVTEDEPTTDDDGVDDPELSEQELRDILNFLLFLAPPPQLPMDEEAQQGEQLFEQMGCAGCHIPNLVRNGEPIFAYTDLLIHDMGPGLADGIDMGSATGSDFRTQPLWGVRHSAPYLHDGSADTLEDAILRHGGEAQRARDSFDALIPEDRAAVIKFLETR